MRNVKKAAEILQSNCEKYWSKNSSLKLLLKLTHSNLFVCSPNYRESNAQALYYVEHLACLPFSPTSFQLSQKAQIFQKNKFCVLVFTKLVWTNSHLKK